MHYRLVDLPDVPNLHSPIGAPRRQSHIILKGNYRGEIFSELMSLSDHELRTMQILLSVEYLQ